MRLRIKAAALGFALLAGMASVPSASHAQAFPNRAIRIVVPFAPGGANDVLARLFAPRLSTLLGQSVVVENRSGAGSNIGTEVVAHAAPDGYTLLYTTDSLAIAQSLYPRLGYKLEDLTPLSLVGSFPMALVTNPALPVRNLRELVALARQRNGLNYGSPGVGSSNHLTGVLFGIVSDSNNIHVPYRGAGPMMTALVGGEIDFATPNVFTAAPFVRTGQVRAVAVTSRTPTASLPGVPTLASEYSGFDMSLWHGFFTTGGTPASVIEVLHRAIIQAVHSPEIREALAQNGAEIVGNSPAEFQAIIAADIAKYAELVRISGATTD
jgi:tripartite-type tricarboxylate transporter receptor subunit TctC